MQKLPQLNTVYEKYRDHPRVAILAVNIEPIASGPATGAKPPAASAEAQGVSHAEVRALFEQQRWTTPIVRDPQQHARTIFGVEKIPTMFVLGPDGTLEDHETGINPELANDLPARIERLLKGEGLQTDARRRHQELVRQYEAQFQSPPVGDSSLQAATPAAASTPVTFKLTPAWRVDSLAEPGNITWIDDPQQPQLLVHDGGDKLVSLDAAA